MNKIKYTTVQIKKSVHRQLKAYCEEHGLKISGLVETVIRNKIERKSTDNKKVLKVKP